MFEFCACCKSTGLMLSLYSLQILFIPYFVFFPLEQAWGSPSHVFWGDKISDLPKFEMKPPGISA